jgi:pyruvate dehydrogenase E2 component (dihydrolipoamide acetyltransferase)
MSVKIVIPSLGLTMEDAVISEWMKHEGDEVSKDEPILLIETDKATHEVTAPVSGILTHISAKLGDVIPVGEAVAEILTADAYASQGQAVETAVDFYATEDTELEEPSILKASPAAKKKARELQADLQFIKGTGPEGRIIESDVIAYVDMTPRTSSENLAEPLPTITRPISKMRKIIAERMLNSRQTTASVTLFATFSMDEVVRLRKQMNQTLEKRPGHKITFDAIFAKAAGLALNEFPELQAQWSTEGLRYSGEVNIGIAVALTEGLVVPVVQNVENRSLFSAAREVNRLVERGKQGKLTPDEMQGGTFTVSNLGMYPIGGFTPVINLPEAAILGIGGISEQAVVENGAIRIGKVTEVSLTFDHRITDGAPAAVFLTRIKTLIEAPYLLFMEY